MRASEPSPLPGELEPPDDAPAQAAARGLLAGAGGPVREVLAVAAWLRVAPQAFDPAALRAQLQRQVQRLRAQAAADGMADADIDAMVLALAGLVDEIALAQPGTLRDAWLTEPLQWHCCGHQLAGERFFEQLAAVHRRGASARGLLALHRHVLALGFRGRHAWHDAAVLGHWRRLLGLDAGPVEASAFGPFVATRDRIGLHPRRWRRVAAPLVLLALALALPLITRSLAARQAEPERQVLRSLQRPISVREPVALEVTWP